jgi:hypothetical protein
MSYGRMREKRQQLRDEVQQLLAQAEAVDAVEDAEYGPDRGGDELPAELQRRESRLQRLREATRALKARAKDDAAAVQVAVDEQQLVVGQAVTQETNDKTQLLPMIRARGYVIITAITRTDSWQAPIFPFGSVSSFLRLKPFSPSAPSAPFAPFPLPSCSVSARPARRAS